MQKNELVYYIQGNYGYGWEDVSVYPMGERQKNFNKQYSLLKHDLKEYWISGCGSYRVIKRYEPLEEE